MGWWSSAVNAVKGVGKSVVNAGKYLVDKSMSAGKKILPALASYGTSGWSDLLSSLGGILGTGLSYYGGRVSDENNLQIARENMALQKEFAQMGIRWKVQDAKAAGLHPLAALGANTLSYSPVQVGSDLDYGMKGLGQDISRAVASKMTNLERAMLEQDLLIKQKTSEGLEIENQTNFEQLQQLRRRGQIPPPMPDGTSNIYGLDGQNNNIQMVAPEVTFSDQLGIEAGAAPMERKYLDKSGALWLLPTQDASEPMESSMPSEFGYMASKVMDWATFQKNYLSGNYKALSQYRDYVTKGITLKKGYEWRFNPLTGQLFATKIGKEGSRMFTFWSKRDNNGYNRHYIERR